MTHLLSDSVCAVPQGVPRDTAAALVVACLELHADALEASARAVRALAAGLAAQAQGESTTRVQP